ncbi:pseudouridine synthase [Frateuria aurantia]
MRRSPPGGRAAGTVSRPARTAVPRHGVARVISKAGHCSRSQAEKLVKEGRVGLNGRIVVDPETPAIAGRDRITIDGAPLQSSQRIYLAVHKPRGMVTTASDERGRDTVYALLEGTGLPWLGPVGRLDMASEGLLLFTNDSAWAAALMAPESHLPKTYHVQVDCIPDAAMLATLAAGVEDQGEWLAVRSIELLRHGEKQAWLAIVLDEGRNRHIRRLLAAHDIAVRRLVRVGMGELTLGDLPKRGWRHLTPDEVAGLTAARRP